MEAALAILAPKMIAGRGTYKIINYQSKSRLLRRLPKRLAGYRPLLINGNVRLIVLVDRDRDACLALKETLEAAAAAAGLTTKTMAAAAGSMIFHVVNRIVCEELEAWFFGDPQAVRAVFPRVPATFESRASYRIPDSIQGPWEALSRLLVATSSTRNRVSKIDVARRLAEHMDPDRNRSRSFQAFRDGLESIFQ